MNTQLQSISEAQNPVAHSLNNVDKAELGLRVTEKAKGADNESCRRSLLPQRATTRQSSIGVQPMKRANPSGNAVVGSTKENSFEPKPFLNDGKTSVSSAGQDRKQKFSQAKIRVPLLKDPGRSLMVQKGKSENGPGQGRIQGISSTAPISHLPGHRKIAIPRSNSLMRPVSQPKPQPPPNMMPSQSKRPTSETSSLSSVSCISIETAKNEDDCGEETSDQVIHMSESLPIQRGKGILGSGQSNNHPTTKNAPSNLKFITSAKFSSRKTSARDQRPPFSALKQHFSPKKSLKAPTTSFSAQPKGNTHTTSTEVFQSQIELMQLYLLHRSAAEVLVQWQQSADQSMKNRFTLFCKRQFNFQCYVRSQQASINQSALLAWCEDASNVELAQNVQLFSRNILELYRLVDSGGKYVSVLRQFESWFTSACYLQDSRKYTRALRQSPDFIEGIGDDWKAEIAVLERKLATCSRQLRSIRKPQENSALGHVLSAFQTMVANLMDELDVIQRIEKDVLAQEISRIERQVEDLVKSDADLLTPVPNLGIWNDPLEKETNL